jgi:transcriptional regulator with XRE-family HTH domain
LGTGQAKIFSFFIKPFEFMRKIVYSVFMSIHIDEEKFKKELGCRFREVRHTTNLSQKELADRYSTSQSSIANIERGSVYPNLILLYRLNHDYKLNITWLLTGKGDMFIQHEAISGIHRIPLSDRYVELINFMKHPDMERIILSKLTELQMILGRT